MSGQTLHVTPLHLTHVGESCGAAMIEKEIQVSQKKKIDILELFLFFYFCYCLLTHERHLQLEEAWCECQSGKNLQAFSITALFRNMKDLVLYVQAQTAVINFSNSSNFSNLNP